jgi:Zn-dependent alcohol dehydrogenase
VRANRAVPTTGLVPADSQPGDAVSIGSVPLTSRIFAIDPVELKRETAANLGATDLADPTQADPGEQVKAATAGRGGGLRVRGDWTSAHDRAGLPAARRGGTVVIVGFARPDDTALIAVTRWPPQ